MFAKYERRGQPLLPRLAFYKRVAVHVTVSVGILAGSLFIGILGYHLLDGLSWTDSLVNASMLLGGMGPVDVLHNDAAKIFASFYALYSGIIFLLTAGIIIAPVAHRILHRFHLEAEADAQKEEG